MTTPDPVTIAAPALHSTSTIHAATSIDTAKATTGAGELDGHGGATTTATSVAATTTPKPTPEAP